MNPLLLIGAAALLILATKGGGSGGGGGGTSRGTSGGGGDDDPSKWKAPDANPCISSFPCETSITTRESSLIVAVKWDPQLSKVSENEGIACLEQCVSQALDSSGKTVVDISSRYQVILIMKGGVEDYEDQIRDLVFEPPFHKLITILYDVPSGGLSGDQASIDLFEEQGFIAIGTGKIYTA